MLRGNATAPAASKPNLKRDATHSRTMALMTAWARMVTYSSLTACPRWHPGCFPMHLAHTLDMMIFALTQAGVLGTNRYVTKRNYSLRLHERLPISGPGTIPTARFVKSFAGGGGFVICGVVFPRRHSTERR